MLDIVLCMIVKNESRVIERCLSSTIGLIDKYCIVDTGSDDGTPEIITEFFNKHGVLGEVHHREWKNFGHNRTESLDLARETKSSWILTLDADMILVNEGFKKSDLSLECSNYDIFQQNPGIRYTNTRIMNSRFRWKSVGVTHEYLAAEDCNLSGQTLTSLWINDIGDGGSKSDKFERDIKLLTQGLLDEPNNERYMFYLAQSYKDTQQFEKAIDLYQKRIKARGWYEEVWYSHYMIASCYLQLGKKKEAEHWTLNGYRYYPKRSEAIYMMCKKYREDRDYNKALEMYNLGKGIEYPESDKLFINHNIYKYQLFEYEMTILYYYLFPGDKKEGVRKCINYLSINPSNVESVFNNLKYYVSSLLEMGATPEELKLDEESVPEGFINSSWCKIKLGEREISNVRLVNYKIEKETGAYKYFSDGSQITGESCLDNPIQTKNLLLGSGVMEEDYTIPVFKASIVGLEDMRIYPKGDKIQFLATCRTLEPDEKNRICSGEYDIDTNKITVDRVYPSPTGSVCEKNWTFLNSEEIIYNWRPLSVYSLDNLEKTREFKTPIMFNYFRGSTSSIDVGDLKYTVVHTVNYGNPRTYLHYLVIMEKSGKPLMHSFPFSFEGEQIEYCLSINIEEDQIEFNYSTWDSSSKLVKVPLAYFTDQMIYLY
jgi:glycosyltransferase involved in cell wall biosynthesis